MIYIHKREGIERRAAAAATGCSTMGSRRGSTSHRVNAATDKLRDKGRQRTEVGATKVWVLRVK